MRVLFRPGAKHFRPFYDYGTVATENRLSKCSGRPLGLCGRRLPELNLIPIQVIDPGKATVGFIHSFGVNLYSLLFQAVEQSIQIVHDVVDHERLGGRDIVGGGGKNSPNCNVFLLRVVVFAPRKHHAMAFVSESKMLRIPFAHLITISGFEEDTADSKDAPALLHFDGRLRLFRLRRFHFLSSYRTDRDEQQRAERNCAPRYSLHVPPTFTNQGFLYTLSWLPKLDLIAIWIFDPRKVPVAGILLGLFDLNALGFKMAEDFFHALHSIVNLTRSWLIPDVLIRGHNRPR